MRRGSTREHLARKYGMTEEQVAASQTRLTGLAAAEGLEYHLDETQGGNTFDAHRALHAAREAQAPTRASRPCKKISKIR